MNIKNNLNMIKFVRVVCLVSRDKYRLSVPKWIYAHSFKCYSKEVNLFNKFLNKGSKKRKWHNNEFQIFSPAQPSLGSVSKGPESKKRVAVLNKLFMKHITDLMATGSSADKIVGLGIEITKVKVGSEYNIVNVYWTCHKDHREDERNMLLAQSASILRQELTSLRVIGKVPKINFVRDRSVQSWAVVEALLKTADMGENYMPKGDDLLKNDFGNENLESKAAPDIGDMPPMRQNVFGVDRLAILSGILAKMKSRPSKRTEIENNLATHTRYAPFNEDAFSQFLLKRRIMKDKLCKNDREEQDFPAECNDYTEEYKDNDDGDYLEETEDER